MKSSAEWAGFIGRGFRYAQPYYPIPAVYQWSFSIQQKLSSSWALEGDYVGSHTIHQFQFIDSNAAALEEWAARTPWVDFLAADPAIRSNTSVCLKVVDERVRALEPAAQAGFASRLTGLLEREGVALDAASYRSAPPGLRIWCGATIEVSDVAALTPWLDWAFAAAFDELKGLSDVLAEHEFRFEVLVHAEGAQGGLGGAAVGRVLRVGDSEVLHGRVAQRRRRVERGGGGHPNHDTAHGVGE